MRCASRPPGFGPAQSGDDVLVGYDCTATFPDGSIDTTEIREPLVGADGRRAIVQFVEWRQPYAELPVPVPVSFKCVWLPRVEAIRQGFISGRDDL